MREQFYLAGKKTDKDGLCWKRSLVEPFEGLCDFVSSDGNHDPNCDHGWKAVPTAGWDMCNYSYKFVIETMALDPIRKSRALIACLKSSDSFGSIAEIAFASAIGKESHLIVCEGRTEEQKMWDYYPLYDSYWFVASFPGVSVQCVENDDEAIECLQGILKGYGVGCEPESYVYFIEAIGKDEIKIGSANDPQKRLAQLQTANAAQLILLGAMEGGPIEEKRLHTKFGHVRISRTREWFRATDELRSYVATAVGVSTAEL